MRHALLAMAVCACSLAGCGGDDEEGAKGRSVTVTAAQGVRIIGREYSFDPAAVLVRGGARELEITLDNRGSLAHNVKIQASGDPARDLGGSPTFPGGQARSGSVRLSPGTYRMVCTVGDHEQLGMTGTLEVER